MESGQTWNDESEHTSEGRDIARGVLFIPRWIAWYLLLPMRGAIYVYDRYDLRNRYDRTFYNTDRTFGIHPSIEYATGYSIRFGGRLISSDTFGERERLTMAAAYGGTYQTSADAWLDTGRRLAPAVFQIGGNFDRFARLAFYGIGNADGSRAPSLLVDPRTDDTAVRSYYRYQELRAAANATLRMAGDLSFAAHGAVTNLTFAPSTRDPAIDSVYDRMGLVGFDEGVTHLYGQLELRWDRRRIARPPWETTQYTTGWLASGFVGGVHGFDEARNFAHYGVDLQAFLHLALGPRMLWLRFLGEGVTGSVDEVPFVELPYLGGDFLRGYDFARFRDRVSALGTAQYMWDLSQRVDAYLFVDAGRVYRAVDDLTLDDLRVGYGGGFSVHTATAFVIAASLASSRDGGLFLTASLNPVWNEAPRWR